MFWKMLMPFSHLGKVFIKGNVLHYDINIDMVQVNCQPKNPKPIELLKVVHRSWWTKCACFDDCRCFSATLPQVMYYAEIIFIGACFLKV